MIATSFLIRASADTVALSELISLNRRITYGERGEQIFT